jgi:hypothetical protein
MNILMRTKLPGATAPTVRISVSRTRSPGCASTNPSGTETETSLAGPTGTSGNCGCPTIAISRAFAVIAPTDPASFSMTNT